MVVVSSMPSRVFFSNAPDVDDAHFGYTLLKVLTHAVLKLALLLGLDWIVRRRVGFSR